MQSKRSGRVLLRNIGSQVAEDEADSLRGYYLPNKYFQAASRFNIRHEGLATPTNMENKQVFFIGRTGSGKSAILEMIRQNSPDGDRIISVNNDDIALQMLVNSPELETIPKFLQPLLFKCLWKYVILTNVLKKIYGATLHGWYNFIHSEDEDTQELFRRFDEVVPTQQTMAKQVLAFIRVAKKVDGLSGLDTSQASEKLHGVFRFLLGFEESKLQQHLARKYLHVLIDDLDREWSGREENVLLIKSLFECIIDLTRRHSSNLKFVVALRTDIFAQVNFHQREKVREYVTEIKWTPADLERLVEMRLRTFWNLPTSKSVWEVFPDRIPAGPQLMPTYKYLISRTLWRPRDIINFVNLCIDQSQARGDNRIQEKDVLSAEKIYSRQRSEALVDEWRFTYPEISVWIDSFAGTKRVFPLHDIEAMGHPKAVTDSLFRTGFLGFREGGHNSRLVFSFSTDYEAPIPNKDLVINRAFNSFLLARAEQLGQSVDSIVEDANEEVLERVENASLEGGTQEHQTNRPATSIARANPKTDEQRVAFHSNELDSDEQESNNSKQKRVFVCYARENEHSYEIADRVTRLLDPWISSGYMNMFIDREKISDGESWRNSIERELKMADVAVVFLSEPFFSSNFIREFEMPLILERHAEGNLKAFIVNVEGYPLIDHVKFKYPHFQQGPKAKAIRDLQFLNDKPYCELNAEDKKKKVIDVLANRIVEHFEKGAG